MSDLPKLSIMLLTYTDSMESPRARYAEQTLDTVLRRLHYRGQISVHIADDGSPPEHVRHLYELAGGYAHVQGVSTTTAERQGYGASYNLATQVVHTHASVVLPLEDDWILSEPIDIEPYVAALTDPGPISSIRMGYLGFTEELRGTLGHCAGRTYLLLDPASPEHHVNAGHPRLETTAYERVVGPWAEGYDPGTTERIWCGRPAARSGVAWPMDAPRGGWFSHIGTVQARHDQQPAEAVV